MPVSRSVYSKISKRKGNRQQMADLVGVIATALLAFGVRSVKKRNHIPRRSFSFHRHVEELGETYFRRLYRMSSSDLYHLQSMVRVRLERFQSRPKNKHPSVEVSTLLAITIRYLAGAQCLDIGWPYGIATATVYVVIDECLEALNDELDNIKFPVTRQECTLAAKKFQELRDSPFFTSHGIPEIGVIGALDGIAVAIRRPRDGIDTDNPRSFFNRKCFYSICVQAVVGADYKINYVSAKHAGSTHDSTAFQSTNLYTVLNKPESADGGLPEFACIAADDAYGNGSCCGRILTPYSGRLEVHHDTFNYYWSSMRIIVEQVFGVVVARWGILWSPLRCALKKSTKIIVVCCKLHNYLLERNGIQDTVDVPDFDDSTELEGENVVYEQSTVHTEDTRNRNVRAYDKERRESAASRLHSLGYKRPALRNW